MKTGLCLNMIVKNEEKIMPRCLRSVLPVIAAYEITDTGSTDNTKDIIRDILHGVPGYINNVPFQNFSQARNAALDRARISDLEFSHVLLIDADMELVCSNKDAFLEEVGTLDVGSVTQVASTLSYENVRILRRTIDKAHYVGRTHEYINLPGGLTVKTVRSARMLDHACGSSRSEKFERDARLLGEELKDNPGNFRAAFYLAQTYKDWGKRELAIEWYKKRAGMGGWSEEVYCSHLYAGRLLAQMGMFAEAVVELEKAIEVNPLRAEAFTTLAKLHREKGMNETALFFAEWVFDLSESPPEGALFVETDAYRPVTPMQEFSIAGFYSKRAGLKDRGRSACFELTTSRKAFPGERDMARRNCIHYAKSLADTYPNSHVRVMPITGVQAREGYNNVLNPSIVLHDGKLHAIIRTVNYKNPEGRHGHFPVHEGDGIVRTENHFGVIDPETGVFTGELLTDESGAPKSETARVRGFEDMRLFRWRGSWWALASTRDREGMGELGINEIVLIRIEGTRCTEVHRLCPGTKRCEKNWLPFIRDDELLILYSTDPMCWLRVNPETMKSEPYSVAFGVGGNERALDHQRGGTNLVETDDGYIYLTHEAIDMNSRRTYLHRWIKVNRILELTSASDPFFFDERGIVEFASGLARHGDKLIVGYGRKDEEARLAVMDLASLASLP